MRCARDEVTSSCRDEGCGMCSGGAAESRASYGHVPARLRPLLLTAKAYHYRATDNGTLYLHRNTDAGTRARAGALSAGAAGLALASRGGARRATAEALPSICAPLLRGRPSGKFKCYTFGMLAPGYVTTTDIDDAFTDVGRHTYLPYLVVVCFLGALSKGANKTIRYLSNLW